MEQDLIDSLTVESISIYGHEVFYCPRVLGAKDEVYGEDRLSSYKTAYDIDMYISSYDSYEGDGTFLSKFNLEIRDQIVFVVANRTFENEITTQADIVRPREGDLIYSKMFHRLFIIKYVDNKATFYQMGKLQSYKLTCEVFEYSNENLATGVPEIDAIQKNYSFAGTGNTAVSNTAYEKALSNVFETNQEFQVAGPPILDWSSVDPFSDGKL